MKLKFLCVGHRQQLQISTSRAVRCWQSGFDTAQFFMTRGYGVMGYVLPAALLKLQKF